MLIDGEDNIMSTGSSAKYKSFHGVDIRKIFESIYDEKQYADIVSWLDKQVCEKQEINYATETAMLKSGKVKKRKKGTEQIKKN